MPCTPAIRWALLGTMPAIARLTPRSHDRTKYAPLGYCVAAGGVAMWPPRLSGDGSRPRAKREENHVSMRYLHTMVRIGNIEQSLDFYCAKLGMQEVRRVESEAGRYTLIFLAAPEDKPKAAAERAPLLELTFNWDPEKYGEGRNFGHLAFEVDNIYQTC